MKFLPLILLLAPSTEFPLGGTWEVQTTALGFDLLKGQKAVLSVGWGRKWYLERWVELQYIFPDGRIPLGFDPLWDYVRQRRLLVPLPRPREAPQ